MNARETYGSKFLRVTDLKTKRVVTRIQAVRVEEFARDGKTDAKLVVTLKGFDKDLVLNKTNADVLMDLYGDETDGWLGKTITLQQAKVRFRGETTPCIRIEEPSAEPLEFDSAEHEAEVTS
jgi:hypothetical protein